MCCVCDKAFRVQALRIKVDQHDTVYFVAHAGPGTIVADSNA